MDNISRYCRQCDRFRNDWVGEPGAVYCAGCGSAWAGNAEHVADTPDMLEADDLLDRVINPTGYSDAENPRERAPLAWALIAWTVHLRTVELIPIPGDIVRMALRYTGEIDTVD